MKMNWKAVIIFTNCGQRLNCLLICLLSAVVARIGIVIGLNLEKVVKYGVCAHILGRIRVFTF